MDFVRFIKLVAKFVALFTGILVVVGGTLLLSYKFIKGDINIAKGIEKIAGIVKENPRVNVLLMGTDESGLRTDFIMFVTYNPNNKKINGISIPRDTWVPDSVDHKINSTYLKNKEEGVKAAVEKIIGLPVNYYVTVNLKGFRKLVDTIGGIPMDVPTDMTYEDPYQNLTINIKKGYQILDGRKAEGFVRFRSGYANADLGRIKAQQQFLKAAAAQLLKPQNITKLPTLIQIVLENVKTNATTADMLKYVDDAAKINKDNIEMASLPGKADYIHSISYFVYDGVETRKLVDNITIYAEDEPDDKIIKRNQGIKVEVLNGTNVAGLGTKAAEQLKQKGFDVVSVGNYSSSYITETKILERNRAVQGYYVKNALKVGEVKSDYSNNNKADVTVILGKDFS